MSRNGRHDRWDVRPSDRFREHLERDANEPRLREVLDGLEMELRRAPFQEDKCYPVNEAKTRWVMESEAEVPPYVYLTFSWWNQRVTMEDYLIVQPWEDQVFDESQGPDSEDTSS